MVDPLGTGAGEWIARAQPSREPPPATAADRTRASFTDYTVILKFIVSWGWEWKCVVAVVIILQVDLKEIILAGVWIYPEVKVGNIGDVSKGCASKATKEARNSTASPASLQRE